MVGKGNAPTSLSVRPAIPTAGTPGPSAPAATLVATWLCGKSSSALASSSDRSRPDIVAGFQNKAPAASNGAAVDAPAIERLTGPVPDRIVPICALAAPAVATAERMAR